MARRCCGQCIQVRELLMWILETGRQATWRRRRDELNFCIAAWASNNAVTERSRHAFKVWYMPLTQPSFTFTLTWFIWRTKQDNQARVYMAASERRSFINTALSYITFTSRGYQLNNPTYITDAMSRGLLYQARHAQMNIHEHKYSY